MSVDTYVGRRNTRNYNAIEQDGVKVLVSKSLAPYLQSIALDSSKFLFIHRLKPQMELTNGMVVVA